MNKLRLIQCGLGAMGISWLRDHTRSSPDFELVAVVDPSDKARIRARHELAVPEAMQFATLEEALDRVPADAVLTVTPPAVHAAHALLAFERGMHVMTEKPIADTLGSAKRMVAMARDIGRQLLVSQNSRYTRWAFKMKQLLATSAIGTLGHGHLDFYIPADFPGTFRETMQFPLLVDMAIHHIDLIRHITGRNIARVTAMSFRPAWSWFAHEPGLKMLMELTSPDGAGETIPFSYSGDWTALGRCTSWSGHWRLQGSEGSLHWKGEQITLERCERWMKNPQSQQFEPDPIEREGLAATLHNFADAIRTGIPAETSGEDNLHSFAAVIAAVTSAREKRTVKIADLLR